MGPYVPDMTICAIYLHMYQISPSVPDIICTRYHHLYQISPSVPDITICTRYHHLYWIWPYVPDMTICTRYDYLYQISPSVPDMTICTGYDHLYRICLLFKFIAWILITPIRWSRINFNDICDFFTFTNKYIFIHLYCRECIFFFYEHTFVFMVITLLIYSFSLSGHWQLKQSWLINRGRVNENE
jgi:hypothetical protein